MKKIPWHSIKAGVHHTCTNCKSGNSIKVENLRTGTSGKPLCLECSDLIKKGGC